MTFRQEPSSFYSDLLGFKPKDEALFRLAFLHNSCQRRDKSGRFLNNERLEFLGDAVIESYVSERLYLLFPDASEGALTSMRSRIVQRDTLNHVAAQLHFERYLSANVTLNEHNRNMLGNAFEALVGAVSLDQGYSAACDFLERRLFALLDLQQLLSQELDFKSRLFEWAQKNHADVSFVERPAPIPSSGDDGFHSSLLINGVKTAEAWGFSKKEAQQKASHYALRDLQRFPLLVQRISKARS
ncbi:MAG: ribonuclease III [Paludibacteraceae bacterium]|nr:ribonuclease III [Paludibacteraceae bacterium]